MLRRVTPALLAGVLLALVSAGSPPSAAAATCPGFGHVAPGGGPAAFTMLIRINQMSNVTAWTNFDSSTGGLGGRVRPQDTFVVNTRFDKTPPAEAEAIAQALRAAFPCNRIMSLNGLHSNPAYPGWFGSLVGSTAGIWSYLLDYEAMDWNTARFHDPSKPPWSYKFTRNVPRVRGFSQAMSGSVAASPNTYARTGLIPVNRGGWDYGLLARKLDKANGRLGRHAGVQVVQTQEACASGSRWFAREIKRLHLQYRFKTVYRKRLVRRHGKKVRKKVKTLVKLKKSQRPNPRNLVAQISFSDSPAPNDPLPVRSTGPQTADGCTQVGMAHGQRAFFYFGSNTSMRLLFQQPFLAALRPPLS